MVCHASYPLNSEKASPPGTVAVYLSGAAAIRLPTTASHPTAIPIVSMFLRFIQSPLVSSCVETVSDARRLSVDQTLEHVVAQFARSAGASKPRPRRGRCGRAGGRTG